MAKAAGAWAGGEDGVGGRWVRLKSTQAAAGAPVAARTLGSQMGIYMELSKARLSSLVVLSSAAGFLMAGSPVSTAGLLAVSTGTCLAAFSANTWNQIWEVKNDALMARTRKRPLPSGRISRGHAAAWGVATAAASTAVLAAGCNPLTAALGVANIGLYALVYTPLKTRSVANTWVGSVVGAIPPVMGWTAATGTLLSPEAAVAGALLYLWQFPHFFALSWRSRVDYAAGGYRMISVADQAGKRTARLVRRYAWYMAALPFASYAMGVTSPMYAVESVVVNAYFLHLAHTFARRTTNGNAQRVFMASLWYLPLMMGLMVYHCNNWADKKEKEAESHQQLALRPPQAAAVPPVLEDAPQEQPPVDAAVAKIRAKLSTLCPHEQLKESERHTCPVGDRVEHELKAVRDGSVDAVRHGVAAVQAASSSNVAAAEAE